MFLIVGVSGRLLSSLSETDQQGKYIYIKGGEAHDTGIWAGEREGAPVSDAYRTEQSGEIRRGHHDKDPRSHTPV